MWIRWVAGAGAMVIACGGPVAAQQVVERDTEIVGPKGKTIDRHLKIERTPGAIHRELDIRRPGGELHRSVTIPTGRGPGPRPGFGPGPRGPLVVERDVIVQRGGGGNGWVAPVAGFAGFAAGTLLGTALARPAVVQPAPVLVAPGPMYAPAPVVVQPVPVPAPAVVDNVSAEVDRLKSWSGSTRLEAVKILGRLNDPRAVPPLVHSLRSDYKDEVREHAAWALGMIGDPSARPYLEVASTSDSKGKVREASIRALERLDANAALAAAPIPPVGSAPPAGSSRAGSPSVPPPPPPSYAPRSMDFQVTAGPQDRDSRSAPVRTGGPDPR